MVKIQSGISIYTHSLTFFKFVKNASPNLVAWVLSLEKLHELIKKIFFSLKIKLEISSNHLMILDG